MLIPKQNYIRDKAFRKWIASLPCMRCGQVFISQAAHFGKGGRGIKGCDSTCRPLCADTPGRQGCHTKFDQHKDDFWTPERVQEVIDLPIYELWKAGRIQDAMMGIVKWKRS